MSICCQQRGITTLKSLARGDPDSLLPLGNLLLVW